jgi:hypothetical protein
VTDSTEQCKPELLCVVLVALHLYHSEPVPMTLTASPRAQQARLSAASRSGDDRYLPRGRLIQGGEKISPVDQSGVARATVKGPP